MQVPVKIDIPENLVSDYLRGSLEITKAVVRNTENGRIVKHLNLNKTMDFADKARKALTNKNVLIGVGAATVIIAGGIFALVVNKNKAKAKVELPECVLNFQEKFRVYLNEAKCGELNVETIDSLLAILDEVEATQGTDITIDFSTNELKTLLTQIFEYTQKLAESANISASDLIRPNNDSLRNFVNLRDYLLLQKKIAETA